MVHYFDDFRLGEISYRPQWVEFKKGPNTHRVRDNEGFKVFTRQGWTPGTMGYVRLYGGQVDTGKELTMQFEEHPLRHR